MFTSVTRLCVPLLCDTATATIITADQQAYQAKWPWNGAEPEDSTLLRQAMAGRQIVSHNSVHTPIVGMSAEGVLDYHGVLTLSFHTSPPGPSHGVLAQLVVERAVAAIERERLVDVVAAQQVQVDNLRIALTSNRHISTAVGILMATHKLTTDNAFDLLRRVSQHSHRKLHDIALDVIDTGAIELPAGLTPMPPPASPGNETATAVGRPRPHSFTPCTPRP
ncbi:MAG: ANTAR domain-containing protein [Jatrophihabitantaceae bacterium]